MQIRLRNYLQNPLLLNKQYVGISKCQLPVCTFSAYFTKTSLSEIFSINLYLPSKSLHNFLVTGSCTFQNDDEGHRICMVITLIVIEDSKAWSSWHGDNRITHNTSTANTQRLPTTTLQKKWPLIGYNWMSIVNVPILSDDNVSI